MELRMTQLQQEFIQEGCIKDLIQEEMEIRAQLYQRKIYEEIIWKQNYRLKWLKEGEHNIIFYAYQ